MSKYIRVDNYLLQINLHCIYQESEYCRDEKKKEARPAFVFNRCVMCQDTQET